MPHRRSQTHELHGKQLFITHLAEKLQAMESGSVRLQPLAYRAHAKMLARALAGCPEARVERLLGATHSAVREALANRHFVDAGWLKEAACIGRARAIKRQVDTLLERLATSHTGPATL